MLTKAIKMGATLSMATTSAPAAIEPKKANDKTTPSSKPPVHQSRNLGTSVAKASVSIVKMM